MKTAVKPSEDSNEDGETEEKEEDPDEPEPEVGPPLLTPLSQDAGQSLTSFDQILTNCCWILLYLNWRHKRTQEDMVNGK